jgi:hypothetical protein
MVLQVGLPACFFELGLLIACTAARAHPCLTVHMHGIHCNWRYLSQHTLAFALPQLCSASWAGVACDNAGRRQVLAPTCLPLVVCLFCYSSWFSAAPPRLPPGVSSETCLEGNCSTRAVLIQEPDQVDGSFKVNAPYQLRTRHTKFAFSRNVAP